MKKIKGLYTAIITPFDEEGKLDETGLIENLHFQLNQGTDGITALGTTGESPTLSKEEKERIIQIAAKETKKKNIPLMVGTGSYSTIQAIENTLKAAELGADSALVVTPYYNKPTQEGIYQHFKAIASAVDIPIMLYNIQGRTGQNIQTSTLKRLAQIPNIVGVKEASGNLMQMMDVLEAIQSEREDFSVMSGDDALTYSLMTLGGDGIISVASNLIPFQMKALVKTIDEKNWEDARKLHFELLPLFKVLFIETNPIPIKAAMNLMGFAAGECRLPLCQLSKEHLNDLQSVLYHSTSQTVNL